MVFALGPVDHTADQASKGRFERLGIELAKDARVGGEVIPDQISLDSARKESVTIDYFGILEKINPVYLLLCFASSFALAVGLIVLSGVWNTPPRKPMETLRILWQTIIHACHEAWRGYFAPFRLSPWKVARQSLHHADATWRSPFCAWFVEFDRIVKGKAVNRGAKK